MYYKCSYQKVANIFGTVVPSSILLKTIKEMPDDIIIRITQLEILTVHGFLTNLITYLLVTFRFR